MISIGNRLQLEIQHYLATYRPIELEEYPHFRQIGSTGVAPLLGDVKKSPLALKDCSISFQCVRRSLASEQAQRPEIGPCHRYFRHSRFLHEQICRSFIWLLKPTKNSDDMVLFSQPQRAGQVLQRLRWRSMTTARAGRTSRSQANVALRLDPHGGRPASAGLGALSIEFVPMLMPKLSDPSAEARGAGWRHSAEHGYSLWFCWRWVT